jgi:hypothetical protein
MYLQYTNYIKIYIIHILCTECILHIFGDTGVWTRYHYIYGVCVSLYVYIYVTCIYLCRDTLHRCGTIIHSCLLSGALPLHPFSQPKGFIFKDGFISFRTLLKISTMAKFFASRTNTTRWKTNAVQSASDTEAAGGKQADAGIRILRLPPAREGAREAPRPETRGPPPSRQPGPRSTRTGHEESHPLGSEADGKWETSCTPNTLPPALRSQGLIILRYSYSLSGSCVLHSKAPGVGWAERFRPKRGASRGSNALPAVCQRPSSGWMLSGRDLPEGNA